MVAATVNIFINPAKVMMGGHFARMAPLILASIRQSIYGCSLPAATHSIEVGRVRNPEAERDGALVFS